MYQLLMEIMIKQQSCNFDEIEKQTDFLSCNCTEIGRVDKSRVYELEFT